MRQVDKHYQDVVRRLLIRIDEIWNDPELMGDDYFWDAHNKLMSRLGTQYLNNLRHHIDEEDLVSCMDRSAALDPLADFVERFPKEEKE